MKKKSKKLKDLCDRLNAHEGVKAHFIVGNQTYRQDVLVCFNMSPEECVKVLKRIHSKLTQKDIDYILGDKGTTATLGTMYPLEVGYLVRLKWRKESFRANVLTAMHELLHVTHYILRNVRIPLEENTEEAYTYLMEDLFRQLLHKLYK